MYIVNYYASHDQLSLYTAVTVTALLAVMVTIGLIVRAIGSSHERMISRAREILSELEYENAVFKTIKTDEGLCAALFAGEKELCRTRSYGAVAGAKSAMKSLKANIESGNFTLFVNTDGSYSVRIFTAGKIVFESELFPSAKAAKMHIELIKKAAYNAVIE